MISVKYKTLNIVFDNNTDLLIKQDTMNRIFSKIDHICNTLKRQFNKKDINNDVAVIVRLKNKDALTIFIGMSNDHNPYLFVYNTRTKILTNNISYESFLSLDKEAVIIDLKDKAKNINNPRYNAIVHPILKHNLSRMAEFFDKNPSVKSMEMEIDYEDDDMDPMLKSWDPRWE